MTEDNSSNHRHMSDAHQSKKRKLSHETVAIQQTIPVRESSSDLQASDPVPVLPSVVEHVRAESAEVSSSNSQEWQTVERRSAKKTKKVPKPQSTNYPALIFSPDSRLQSQIKISDLQGLVLYLLADGASPQWISVRHRPQVRKVVVLMVPGLQRKDFDDKRDQRLAEGTDGLEAERLSNTMLSPDEYYPVSLAPEKLPDEIKPFANMFEHLWPVKTPGDDKYSKMHSPLHAMLTAPLPKVQEDKKKKGPKPAREPQGWSNTRTRITEFISSPEELAENGYALHPACCTSEVDKKALLEQRRLSKTSCEDGWVNTAVLTMEECVPAEKDVEAGSLTAGMEVLGMDCEMCKTGPEEFSLTRISLVSWDGSVVMDELVKPASPITDYLTMYSGITEKMLANVNTTLQDVQQKLLQLVKPNTILLGHSLNSDLTALKITHPLIIDTALLYPHPRGPPLKQSLKFLAQKYLNREVQKGHGSLGPGGGHNSVEDARTCLDLVKQKCEKGAQWGTSDSAHENLFKRLSRAGVKYKTQGDLSSGGKTGAAVDWGNPKLGAGAAASVIIGCKSDEDVVAGVIRAVKGDPDGLEVPGRGVDFVWARFRELEAFRGWWNSNKSTSGAEVLSDIQIESKLNSPTNKNRSGDDTMTTLNLVEDPSTAVGKGISENAVTTSDPTPAVIANLCNRIHRIYEALPPCTAFVVYSGSGDPREMSRLQTMQATFKREYKVKKWDDLSIKWTDVEEQALKRAAAEARQGVGFVTVK